jgi:EpsD family peptidyl-prolyl cis-trans isomerase
MNLTMLDASGALPRRWQAMIAVSGLAVAALLSGCGDQKDKGPSQTAAKVNKDEVTINQINFVLQQQRGLRPEQADVVSKQILERLIDQQLILRKAEDQKLELDPRVVQQLEAARREVLSRAYLEKLGESAAKPGVDEIKKYYNDKPALFSDRRVYSLQELAIEAKPEQVAELRESLSSSKNINEFAEFLKSKDYKFSGNQAVRAAEQLPLASLDAISKLNDGQAMVVPAPNGVQVVFLAGSRSQPVNEEQARPAIEQYLLNERKRSIVEEDMKVLRAGAKIEYVGKFAGGASSGPDAGAVLVAPPSSKPTAGRPTDLSPSGPTNLK